MEAKTQRRAQTANHINRIIGQLNTLRSYIEEDKDCREIAQLATSVAKSADGLRARTLQGFITYELCDQPLSDRQQKSLAHMLKLYKK